VASKVERQAGSAIWRKSRPVYWSADLCVLQHRKFSCGEGLVGWRKEALGCADEGGAAIVARRNSTTRGMDTRTRQ
jgi:hypothetical protein